jgi:hypothetical protein
LICPPPKVAKAYKSRGGSSVPSARVNSTLEVRPMFHQRDDSVIGYIVGCFLALGLEARPATPQRGEGPSRAVARPDA